jgi:phospholipid N-methyltransferase
MRHKTITLAANIITSGRQDPAWWPVLPGKDKTMEKKSFLSEAVKSFRTTGAIASSSQHLIRKMLAPINFEEATLIVELGTGDGCVTRAILERMRADARLVAFEINPIFWKKTHEIMDSRLSLHLESATAMGQYIEPGTVDAIVSSLPIAILPKSVKTDILENARAVLRQGGIYIQFQYSFADMKFIRSFFPQISLQLEVRNFPPAIVYFGRKVYNKSQ